MARAGEKPLLASTSRATSGPRRLADGRHDRLGAAGPFVDVVAAFGADAELEGIEAVAVAQAQEAGGLVFRRDVALHRGGVGAELAGLAAEQRHDRLALDLAAPVPERGVEAGHGALEVGAGKLVLLLLDAVDERVDGEGIGAEGIGRDLPVEDLGGDVGVVGRELAPTLGAVLGGDADEADEAVAEGLQALDPHRRPAVI